jgi:amino acid transporter
MGVLKLRREQPDRLRPFRAPGGKLTASIAAIFCLLMLLFSLYLPWRYSTGIPLEWLIIGSWMILGFVFWMVGKRYRGRVTEVERRQLMLGEVLGQ